MSARRVTVVLTASAGRKATAQAFALATPVPLAFLAEHLERAAREAAAALQAALAATRARKAEERERAAARAERERGLAARKAERDARRAEREQAAKARGRVRAERAAERARKQAVRDRRAWVKGAPEVGDAVVYQEVARGRWRRAKCTGAADREGEPVLKVQGERGLRWVPASQVRRSLWEAEAADRKTAKTWKRG